ncbi:DegV family protein [Alicyclobacillus mengziensis]|uniref:DegV family protein n=1 Tax=Alicyclobacillus mengziensis TaxID=2931921 RepID=A0A9X7W0V1_9BACL|nr:DegV family protein [Alicyclobacillus mengziensis]QSO48135.1 DegV family protein [Alicyclobacillus mengziensis]
MKRIAFVTDSTAYLTDEQASALGISVVPLSVIFPDASYREGVDISHKEFYEKLHHSSSLPTTSQPSPGEFVSVFEKLLANHDVVMCLLLSNALSGTLRSAETAASMVKGDVIVVDSKIASYGIAGPLLDGMTMAKQGASPEQIKAYWEEKREVMHSRFLVDTLEYLHKGGRIGGAAAVFGALLQIKPILTVIDGKIELHDKVRTHKRALDRILADFDAHASQGRPIRLGVVHAERQEDAQTLVNELTSKYSSVYAELAELGPVVGAHTGPGLLAFVWYEADPELLKAQFGR